MHITIQPYTKERLEDVLQFERQLRYEEDIWNWPIDQAYIQAVQASFDQPLFQTSAFSYLAYVEDHVVGRIDAVLLPSHFDGSIKAYLDWICVLKSCRHGGVAQSLTRHLRSELKQRGVETLVALIASNPEAQRFYRSLDHAVIKDEGIWIDL